MADVNCINTVDWSATGAMISALAAWAGVGAVIYAASKAENVFAAWKRQKLEERRMDTAERMLSLTYEFEFGIPAIRAPFSSALEMEEAKKELVLAGFDLENLGGSRNINNLITAQVALSRIKQQSGSAEALFKTLPLAKVFFGEPASEMLRSLMAVRTKIMAAASTFSRLNVGQDGSRYELILWFGGDENGEDLIADEVADLKSQIEELLLPVLRHEYRGSKKSAP
jgi:hypothetical protein